MQMDTSVNTVPLTLVSPIASLLNYSLDVVDKHENLSEKERALITPEQFEAIKSWLRTLTIDF